MPAYGDNRGRVKSAWTVTTGHTCRPPSRGRCVWPVFCWIGAIRDDTRQRVFDAEVMPCCGRSKLSSQANSSVIKRHRGDNWRQNVIAQAELDLAGLLRLHFKSGVVEISASQPRSSARPSRREARATVAGRLWKTTSVCSRDPTHSGYLAFFAAFLAAALAAGLMVKSMLSTVMNPPGSLPLVRSRSTRASV